MAGPWSYDFGMRPAAGAGIERVRVKAILQPHEHGRAGVNINHTSLSRLARGRALNTGALSPLAT
eukprot:scaffold28649_cov111-Isochrysis_galbana.AAC.2